MLHSQLQPSNQGLIIREMQPSLSNLCFNLDNLLLEDINFSQFAVISLAATCINEVLRFFNLLKYYDLYFCLIWFLSNFVKCEALCKKKDTKGTLENKNLGNLSEIFFA